MGEGNSNGYEDFAVKNDRIFKFRKSFILTPKNLTLPS